MRHPQSPINYTLSDKDHPLIVCLIVLAEFNVVKIDFKNLANAVTDTIKSGMAAWFWFMLCGDVFIKVTVR